MKFIHLADVHLADKSSFSNNLGSIIRKKSWQSFENIFKENTDVDFALIAGDLFERLYFTAKDFEKLFTIFEEFEKDIYYVSGNHDYFDDYNTIFLNKKPNNLHIFTGEDLSLFEKDNLRVYGLSYKDRIYKNEFPYDLELDNDFFNILLAHGDISQTSTNYLDLDPIKLDRIGFDYIGLGHIHRVFNTSNIYYPSSIEPHDFNHTNDYGYIIYDQGDIRHVDSSLMKFIKLEIYPSDFELEEEIIDFINDKLPDKINILRLLIKEKSDFNFQRIKKALKAKFVEIDSDYKVNLDQVSTLYPNSLLSDFDNSFDGKEDKISILAREIGLEAILRSKK